MMALPALVLAAALVLVAGATRADADACDAIQQRLHGRPVSALRALWRELGVRSGLHADEGAGPLHVVRDELRLPGSLDAYVVLSVADALQADWQLLVLSPHGPGCRYLGAIEAPAQGGEKPAARLAALPDGLAALVMDVAGRMGTGIALRRERWHLLGERGLRTVLDYPARGHIQGWPSAFDRSFTTRAEPAPGRPVETLTVEFTASYTTGSYVYWQPVEPLFTVTRTARYTWRRAERRFGLDLAHSDVYDEEIEGIFLDAEEAFLRHNVRELTQLAASGNERQRAWLRQLLDALPDSPEKTAVRESLR